MASNPRLTIRARLEDTVALAFFLLNLILRVLLRGVEHPRLSPADVLIIIPAMTLLLAKELVHYFVVGKKEPSDKPGMSFRAKRGISLCARPAEREKQGEIPRFARNDTGPALASADLRSFLRPYWEIVRDWFPFLVILLMYYSLWGDATHLLMPDDRDRELIHLDQRWFGMQASVVMQRFITPPLTAWMEFSYFFHILNIPIVACFVYLRRSRSRFREMMSGLMVVSFFGLLGYLLVPAIGPMYVLHDRFTVPLTQPISLFNQQLELMNLARIHRDVFPSMHVAISFLVWLYAFRNSRPLFWLLSPLILSLWVSTVYLRFHYLIDVVAGLLLAPASFLLANWLFRRFGNMAVPIPIPAAWADGLARLGVSGTGKAVEPPGRAEEQP